MSKKGYKDFWDRFNTNLYKEVVEKKDAFIKVRLGKEAKNTFKKSAALKGGMSKVITVFINEYNENNK